METAPVHQLTVRRLFIDTQKQPVAYVHKDSHICRAEGFGSQARILLCSKGRQIIATLHKVGGDYLAFHEIGLSDSAWAYLQAAEGESIHISHPPVITSLGHVRSKIFGHELLPFAVGEIVRDVAANRYSDIEAASFITACAGGLSEKEILALTKAMVDVGERLTWNSELVVDKHCVGGLPGNRTTPIVVSIVAAYGLLMPKTSSRAITSPAGTADVVEVLAPVDLSLSDIRRVVERESGCLAWGGNVGLSPADDILIRIEKALDLDSEGQLVASILSKKLAVGSSHVVIDVPVGPTAKVRNVTDAHRLQESLVSTGAQLGLQVLVHITDGRQPIGRGIGPALEARDVVAVLRGDHNAPQDLKTRALDLAAKILSFSGLAPDAASEVAHDILSDGRAWQKFQRICDAQGGMRDIPSAHYWRTIEAVSAGTISEFDNRRLARVAKMAGAPADTVAGVDLHIAQGDRVEKGQPLFTVYAASHGGLDYALDYLRDHGPVIHIGEG
ncbi:MAG: thymidine phosphorylase family protein [Bdellovibrionales bacterium]